MSYSKPTHEATVPSTTVVTESTVLTCYPTENVMHQKRQWKHFNKLFSLKKRKSKKKVTHR